MHSFFKTLSDPTRLQSVAIIAKHQELCVCELIHALNLPQSTISRHLSILRLNKVVSQRRSGQWVFYSLHPELSKAKRQIIDQAISELEKDKDFKLAIKSLTKMTNRPDHGTRCVCSV